MHSGLSLFSGRQPLDMAVIAQKADALGGDALWRGNMPSSPCRASRLLLAPLGAVSQKRRRFTGVSIVLVVIYHMLRKRGRACWLSLLLSQRTNQQLRNTSHRLFPRAHLTNRL
jgi:hypothetical protein